MFRWKFERANILLMYEFNFGKIEIIESSNFYKINTSFHVEQTLLVLNKRCRFLFFGFNGIQNIYIWFNVILQVLCKAKLSKYINKKIHCFAIFFMAANEKEL